MVVAMTVFCGDLSPVISIGPLGGPRHRLLGSSNRSEHGRLVLKSARKVWRTPRLCVSGELVASAL